jgi:hypothetical protein
VTVLVDEGEVGTLDEANASLAWQQTWTSPDFADGVHTLQLVHATGEYADIDAIQILP